MINFKDELELQSLSMRNDQSDLFEKTIKVHDNSNHLMQRRLKKRVVLRKPFRTDPFAMKSLPKNLQTPALSNNIDAS